MSTFSPDLRITLITTGDQAGIWGNTTNTNLGTIIEDAISGFVSVSVTSAAQAFTALDGVADQARNAMIQLTTTTAANFAVYAPPVSKQYIIWNNTAYTATIYNSTVLGNTTAAGVGVAIASGDRITVFSDGANFYAVKASNITGTVDIANGGTGQTTANAAFNALAPSQTSNNGKYLTTNGSSTSWAAISPGGSTTQVQYNNAGAFGGSANFVFDGTNVGIGASTPSTYGKFVVGGTGSFNSSLVSTSTTLTDKPTLEFRKTATGTTSGVTTNQIGRISFYSQSGSGGTTTTESAYIKAEEYRIGNIGFPQVKLATYAASVGVETNIIDLGRTGIYMFSVGDDGIEFAGDRYLFADAALGFDVAAPADFSNGLDVSAGGLTVATVPVVTTTGSQTLTNKTISGASNTLSNIANASLTNSAITVNSTAISLGGSGTITAVNPNALTIGTGLSGTSYNGSSAVTVAIDSTVATLTGIQTLTNKTLTSPTMTAPVLGSPASGNFSTGTFTWPTFNQNTTGTATTATNIAAGTAGQIPYQTGAGTTAFITGGSAGTLLSSGGGTTYGWITQTSANTASTIVARDASGNFAAGTITADLTGTASQASLATSVTVTLDTSTATAQYINFTNSPTTSSGIRASSALTYVPSTGVLTVGALASTTTATTQTAGDNSTKIATTAFVQAAIPGFRGQAFTANGTFTIPTGVTALKITVVGGGGGGNGFSTGGGTGGTSSVASGTQTITTISATGGVGGYYPGGYASGGAGGLGSNGTLNIGGGGGQTINTGGGAASYGPATGGSSILGGGGSATGASLTGQAGRAYGGGGSSYHDASQATSYFAGGGGGGAAISWLTSLTPGGTLAVTIGGAGTAGTGSPGYVGFAGAAGVVIFEW